MTDGIQREGLTIIKDGDRPFFAEEVCEGLWVIRMDRDDGLGVEHVEKLTEALHVAMAAGV
jgi:hypothetical protein